MKIREKAGQVRTLLGKVDKVLTAYDTLTGESVVGTEFVYVDAGGTAKKMTLAELFEASNSSPSAFIPNGVYEDLTSGYAINAQNKLVAGDNITIDPITNVISASGGGGDIELKTINGESIVGSGDIEIKGSNSVVDSNGFSIYGTRMVANPLSTLEGLTVACMGDSLTQGDFSR